MSNPIAQFTAQERKDWLFAELQARHDRIKALYFDEGLSDKEVARRTKYSLSSVVVIIKQEALANPERAARRVSTSYDKRKLTNRAPLSGAHAKMGIVISRYMATYNLKSVEFGILADLNRSTVSQALTGSHDFTMTELQRVCKLVEMPIEDVFKGMHNGPIRATPANEHKIGRPTFVLEPDHQVQPGPAEAGPPDQGDLHEDDPDAGTTEGTGDRGGNAE